MHFVQGTSPLRLAWSERVAHLPAPRLWSLMAVRFVISKDDSLPVPAKQLQEYNDWSGKYYAYELDKPHPFAWLVYGTDVVPNDDAGFDSVSASDYPLDDKAI